MSMKNSVRLEQLFFSRVLMGAYGSNLEMKLRKRGKVINVNKRNLELANVPWF